MQDRRPRTKWCRRRPRIVEFKVLPRGGRQIEQHTGRLTEFLQINSVKKHRGWQRDHSSNAEPLEYEGGDGADQGPLTSRSCQGVEHQIEQSTGCAQFLRINWVKAIGERDAFSDIWPPAKCEDDMSTGRGPMTSRSCQGVEHQIKQGTGCWALFLHIKLG